ncbi:MAG: 3-oxoacyl-ACP reductase FabG [Alicyclobacillus shizuokensis]|nr:3-oxoacyl-ACP reductase FabG [Alicyclobacillus shizuokensis]
MGRLQDRVAVVTGAARGIGAATAKRLAADGAKVAVLDLRKEACQDTVNAISAAGGHALAVGCDVRDAQQVEAAMQQVVARWGRLDILVNNAGIIRDNLLFRMSEDDWDMVMNVHLKGAFLCSRAAQRYMVEQRYGKIVNTSSTSALGNRGQANYATAKAGLQGFTRTLAIELGPFNINVNAVAPGVIVTPFQQRHTTPAQLESFRAGIPMGRLGTPEDCAGAFLFLASSAASGYVTGQIVEVNGGQLMP